MKTNEKREEEAFDAWIKIRGARHILYIDFGDREIVAGGFATVEEAIRFARERYNIEPVIDPYWIS